MNNITVWEITIKSMFGGATRKFVTQTNDVAEALKLYKEHNPTTPVDGIKRLHVSKVLDADEPTISLTDISTEYLIEALSERDNVYYKHDNEHVTKIVYDLTFDGPNKKEFIIIRNNFNHQHDMNMEVFKYGY